MATGLKKVQNIIMASLQSPYIFTAVAVFAGLIFASAAIASRNPAAGEIAASAIITAGLWALAALTALFGLFIAYNFLRSGREVWSELMQEIQEQAVPLKIEAGRAWQDRLDISPDIILVPGPAETKEHFVARVEAARKTVTASRWAVVFEPGNPICVIYKPGEEGTVFSRATPPFEPVFAKEIPMPADLFSTETEQEFRAYVEAFCRFFPEWSPAAKVLENPRRAAATVLEVFSPVLIGLLLLVSPGLFAQKAQQVEAALGTRIREIPEAETRIEYEFERGSVFRTADGRRDYVTLLKSLPGYRDGGGGKFISLSAGGRIVCQGEQVQEVAQRDEMRPYREAITPRTDAPVSYSLPDSAGMADAAERAKYEVWRATETIGQGVEPWWGVVMYTLWRVFPFLILAGGVSWLFAGVCAREGMYTLHKHSRRAFAILALSVAAVLLINFLLIAVSMGLGPLGLSMVAAAETGAAYWLVTWLIPDFRPAAGNHPREGGYYNDNNPRLLA